MRLSIGTRLVGGFLVMAVLIGLVGFIAVGRLREMEAWDNQRRLVKRQILNVHCTWKFPSGKTVEKVFKQRIAPSCDAAIKELSSDLKRPMSADCNCTGASPTGESP